MLLTDIHGGQWLFRFDGAGRLCYSKNGSSEHILQNGATEDFDLVTDGDGNFHLVTQTEEGSLIYLTYDFNNWKRYVILRSKSNRNAMSGFKIFAAGEKIHCFYKLMFKGRAMLVYHTFSPDEPPDAPEVIGYMAECGSFCCAMDTDESIHIFYFDEAMGLCSKVCSSGAYTDGTLPPDDDIKSVCCVCNGDGLHLLYTAQVKAYCTLIYFNPQTGERKIVSFGDSNISSCCIYTEGRSIHLQWRERTHFYRCTSANGGAAFGKPSPMAEVRGKRISTVRVRSPRNPKALECDRRIIAMAENQGSFPRASGRESKIHTSSKNDYNIIEASYPDEIKIMQSRIRENEKELARLNSIVNTLSDKIRALKKAPDGAASVSPKALPNLLSGADIGEVNEENYNLFKNTSPENMNSESSKTF